MARRRGIDLAARGVDVVAIGGATNIAAFVARYDGARLLGLCDAGEEPTFRRALERAGVGRAPDRAALEDLGFFVCDADLEDELIRALGPDAVERVIEAAGELPSLRILQRQPAQRERDVVAQLRRFFGSKSGRKARYAALLTEALDLDALPRPLDRLVAQL